MRSNVAGRGSQGNRAEFIDEAVKNLAGVRRATFGVNHELSNALERIAEALAPMRRWQDLRRRFENIHVPGSAGTKSSVGDLLRERAQAKQASRSEDRPNAVDARAMYEGRPPWDVVLDLIAQVEATKGGTAELAKLREWCSLWRRWPPQPSDPQLPPQPLPPRRKGRRQFEAYWLAVHEVVGYVRADHLGRDGCRDGYVSWPCVVAILRKLGWEVGSSWRKLRERYEKWLKTVPTVLGYEPPTRQRGGLREVDEAAWKREIAARLDREEGSPPQTKPRR